MREKDVELLDRTRPSCRFSDVDMFQVSHFSLLDWRDVVKFIPTIIEIVALKASTYSAAWAAPTGT